jgi:hypothetical protein
LFAEALQGGTKITIITNQTFPICPGPDSEPGLGSFRRRVSVVPQSMSWEIPSRLNEAERHPESLDVKLDALEDADDGYDPMEFAEQRASTYAHPIVTEVGRDRCRVAATDRRPRW